jgi:GNAT superfamily N-acetyltransferase
LLDSSAVSIRVALESDCDRMAILAQQLGYPVSVEQVQQQFQCLQTSDNDTIFVAEKFGEGAIGFIHIHRRTLLLFRNLAEILALVVDELYRGQGIGSNLVKTAEQWAKNRQCEKIWVRTNATRQAAHQFYDHLGYNVVKQSLVFSKFLEGN